MDTTESAVPGRENVADAKLLILVAAGVPWARALGTRILLARTKNAKTTALLKKRKTTRPLVALGRELRNKFCRVSRVILQNTRGLRMRESPCEPARMRGRLMHRAMSGSADY